MCNQLPEEKLKKINELSRLLSPLAERIGTGTVPDRDGLKDILFKGGVEIEEWLLEEFEVWSGILQKARTVSSEAEKRNVIAQLRARGIREAPVMLTVDKVMCSSHEPRKDTLPPSPSSTVGVPPKSGTTYPIEPSPTIVKKTISPEEDIQFEIARHNFVRAAMLAQQHQYPRDEVRYLQGLALKKYAFEYRNYPGLCKLVGEYKLSEADLERILGKSVKEILNST